MENTGNKLQDQLKEIKEIRRNIDLYKSIHVDTGYIKTNHKIKQRLVKQTFIQVFNQVAAILLLPLLISTLLLIYIINHKEPAPVLYTEIKAAPGTIIQTELPDQSKVWLNSGSSLRYPNQFADDKRNVELTGEGFFNIRTDPARPFEVSIPSGLQIIARGTAFNVNAYDDEPYNEIVLHHGLVDVKLKNEYIQMSPNGMLIFHKQDYSISKLFINADDKIAWKDGRLIFRNTPLDEVMRKLSRRYNVKITLHNKNNATYRIRATITNETITQILDLIKMAAPIEWKLSNAEQNKDASFSQQHIDVIIK